MGREVKRVDFDFEWFENNKNERGNAKTWFGYVLDSIPCPCCEFGKNSKGNYCPICEGESEVYPCIEVPKGDGWQMWENVSEGSPISPVFKTPEEHDDDFYEFKEKFIRSLDEYTDKKGLISTKFVKIAFDRCEEVESRQVQVMYWLGR